MLRVLGDRVLVLLPEPEDEITTASGLVLLRDPDRRKTPTRGIVVQLGEKTGTVELDDVRAAILGLPLAEYPEREVSIDALGMALDALRPAPFDVAVGDCVIFPLGAGEEFTDAGHDYVVLREDEILGVLQPKDEAA